MKPSKLLESFYRKVYIAIVPGKNATDVFVQMRKHGKILGKSLQTFDTPALGEEALACIAEAASQSPLHYIAVLDTLPAQGAVPTCSLQELPRYADATSCQTLCLDGSWSVFASDESLYQIQETYGATGLDFIFSPFLLLRHYFASSVAAEAALYLLLGETFVAAAVFKEKRLLFGEYVTISDDDAPAYVVDIDSQEPESEWTQDRIHAQEHGARRYYTRITQALQSFYSDEKYEKVFIEKVLIADASGAGEPLKKMLEDELFVGVERYEVTLAEEVAALAIAEVEDED
jgi:hypothetical protein